VANPGSEQPQLCAARNSVTGILSVNPVGVEKGTNTAILVNFGVLVERGISNLQAAFSP
jgi:hypothetical protein